MDLKASHRVALWFPTSFLNDSVDDDERNILPILICGDLRNFLSASSLECLFDVDITFCVLVVDNNEHFSLFQPWKDLIVEMSLMAGGCGSLLTSLFYISSGVNEILIFKVPCGHA